MQNIWVSRGFRFWVLILLPISIYFGFLAYKSHVNVINWQALTRITNERLDTSSTENDKQEIPMTDEEHNALIKSIINDGELLNKASLQIDLHNKSRDYFLKISVLIILLPLFISIIFIGFVWIWSGALFKKS